VTVVFVAALFGGSGAIAYWIAVRFPSLAPRSLMVRGIGALVSGALLTAAPVSTATYAGLYFSVFLVLLPLLTLVCLHIVWLLDALRGTL